MAIAQLNYNDEYLIEVPSGQSRLTVHAKGYGLLTVYATFQREYQTSDLIYLKQLEVTSTVQAVELADYTNLYPYLVVKYSGMVGAGGVVTNANSISGGTPFYTVDNNTSGYVSPIYSREQKYSNDSAIKFVGSPNGRWDGNEKVLALDATELTNASSIYSRGYFYISSDHLIYRDPNYLGFFDNKGDFFELTSGTPVVNTFTMVDVDNLVADTLSNMERFDRDGAESPALADDTHGYTFASTVERVNGISADGTSSMLLTGTQGESDVGYYFTGFEVDAIDNGMVDTTTYLSDNNLSIAFAAHIRGTGDGSRWKISTYYLDEQQQQQELSTDWFVPSENWQQYTLTSDEIFYTPTVVPNVWPIVGFSIHSDDVNAPQVYVDKALIRVYDKTDLNVNPYEWTIGSNYYHRPYAIPINYEWKFVYGNNEDPTVTDIPVDSWFRLERKEDSDGTITFRIYTNPSADVADYDEEIVIPAPSVNLEDVFIDPTNSATTGDAIILPSSPNNLYPAYNSTQKYEGNYSAYAPLGANYGKGIGIDLTDSGALAENGDPISDIYLRWYTYIPTQTQDSYTLLVGCFDNDMAGSTEFGVATGSSPATKTKLQLTNYNNREVDGTVDYPLDSWFRIELKIGTDRNGELRWFADPTSNTATDTILSGGTLFNSGQLLNKGAIWFLANGFGDNMEHWVDSISVGTGGWIGTGTGNIWNNTFNAPAGGEGFTNPYRIHFGGNDTRHFWFVDEPAVDDTGWIGNSTSSKIKNSCISSDLSTDETSVYPATLYISDDAIIKPEPTGPQAIPFVGYAWHASTSAVIDEFGADGAGWIQFDDINYATNTGLQVGDRISFNVTYPGYTDWGSPPTGQPVDPNPQYSGPWLGTITEFGADPPESQSPTSWIVFTPDSYVDAIAWDYCYDYYVPAEFVKI